MEIQLTKCSGRKNNGTLLSGICKFVLWRWSQEALLEAPTIIIHRFRVQQETNRNVHTEMYLFAHMTLQPELLL